MRLLSVVLGALGVFLLASVLSRGADPFAFGFLLASTFLLLALLLALGSFAGPRRSWPPLRWVLPALLLSGLLGAVVGLQDRDDEGCPSVVGLTPYDEVDGRCVPVPKTSAVTPAG